MIWKWHIINTLIYSTLMNSFVSSVKFPNDIEGQPQIDCNRETVRISVNTTNGVASRIFTKGHYSTIGCSFERTNTASFNIGACGMNRQRQLEPRGIMYGVEVVVQLHPLFMTKVDRAFNLKCFYMEAEKSVTALLDVSMLSTQSVTNEPPMPVCLYELHLDGPTGPSARYARVGDRVWHTWNCPSTMFGVLVHSCTVTDGETSQFQIIDENGCGVDPYVMRTPQYNTDLTQVQQETHVFKFADKTALVFNCQIKLCNRANNSCAGISPPNCPTLNVTLANETISNFTQPSSNITELEGSTMSTEQAPSSTVTSSGPSVNISTGPSLSTSISTGPSFSTGTSTGPSLSSSTSTGPSLSSSISTGPSLSSSTSTEQSSTTNVTEISLNVTEANVTTSSQLGNVTETENMTVPTFLFPGGEENFTLLPFNETGQESNVSGAVAAVTPQFLLLNIVDGRGRRNVVTGSELEEEIDSDAASIPIRHEKHIKGRLRDDALHEEMETDVTQSMWVLEPEEGVVDDTRQKTLRHGHKLDSVHFSSEDNENEDIENQPSYTSSSGICFPMRMIWAIILPISALAIFTLSTFILCLCRLRKETNFLTIRHMFPFMDIYKRE